MTTNDVLAAIRETLAEQLDLSWLNGHASRWRPPPAGESYEHEIDGWVDVVSPGFDRYDPPRPRAVPSAGREGTELTGVVLDETAWWRATLPAEEADAIRREYLANCYCIPQRIMVGFDGSRDDAAMVIATVDDQGRTTFVTVDPERLPSSDSRARGRE